MTEQERAWPSEALTHAAERLVSTLETTETMVPWAWVDGDLPTAQTTHKIAWPGRGRFRLTIVFLPWPVRMWCWLVHKWPGSALDNRMELVTHGLDDRPEGAIMSAENALRAQPSKRDVGANPSALHVPMGTPLTFYGGGGAGGGSEPGGVTHATNRPPSSEDPFDNKRSVY